MRRVAAEMEQLENRTGCRLSARVAESLGSVPRHLFVPPGQMAAAYDNSALAIGRGQTISQPLIVALMTELLDPRPHHRVLEIGTGSGYQAAVLSSLVERVYGVEIIEALAEAAGRRLLDLGYANVMVRHGDGRRGWPEQAPFDGIIVTAAAAELPSALAAQLKPGGRLVAPLGSHSFAQELWLFEKPETGPLRGCMVLPVAFVPLV
ncbi:MAG: protein-L-isoaspartate(D-aspartate) O-methyltransferase [Magnetospirillum sp.]|nr:MAG: protein-L-isoaspartate(D-aspartate) O-methyltransferase [Magnetospirillum sp.]